MERGKVQEEGAGRGSSGVENLRVGKSLGWNGKGEDVE